MSGTRLGWLWDGLGYVALAWGWGWFRMPRADDASPGGAIDGARETVEGRSALSPLSGTQTLGGPRRQPAPDR
jgi:hypothetical protein